MTGTGTWSGGTMVFNGTTNAFSNTAYAFPFGAYSMFAVYSNTTAPAASAYMNAVYGSNGFPMLGTFGTSRFVSARSVVANTDALARAVPVQVGWAARIASTAADQGLGVTTDTSGNVVVTGVYTAAVTIFNQGPSGTAGTTLPPAGLNDGFIAKYSPAGAVVWAARITGTGADIGQRVTTDSSDNVLVTGTYDSAVTIYNQGPSGAAGVTFSVVGGIDLFIAKYSPNGAVLWAARIAGPGTSENVRGIATDPSGNVFVTGHYNGNPLTFYNQGPSGTAGTTLPLIGGFDNFVAKYSPDGAVLWAARIAGTTTSNEFVNGIDTDSSGNVLVTGYYTAAVTFYDQGPSGAANITLSFGGGGATDAFIAKYSSAGAVLWAARIWSGGVDEGNGIATDPSDNVYVTGYYNTTTATFYNQGPSGTAGTTLSAVGANDAFIAKYSSAGAVLWAARIVSTGVGIDTGKAVATDASGNVFVTGNYSAPLTIHNQGPSGTAGATLPFIGGYDIFVAKYSSDGAVLWAARIAGPGASSDAGNAIATDTSGNVIVALHNSGTAVTFYNQGPSGLAGFTLSNAGSDDAFIVKYNPDGFVTIAATPASSNVLVSATYTPSTFSPFVNGFAQTTLAGTTLTTTGLFLGGPSNYFSGSISEVLIYGTTLTAAQRQSVEGYLSRKWGIGTALISTHPFYTIPPFNRYFNPTDIPGCSLWLDGADGSSLTTGFPYIVTTLASGFNQPRGVAVLSDGNIVVTEEQNHRICVVTPLSVVTTLAGSGTATFADGTGAAASFNSPTGVAVLLDGNIVVADTFNSRIRRVTYPGGVVTTLAGSATLGSNDATGTAATFTYPIAVAVLPNGNVLITDTGTHRIRYMTYPGGVVTTLAGSGSTGFADGTGAAASFNNPGGIAVITSNVFAVTDANNRRIRLVTTSSYSLNSGVVTTLAGQTTSGSNDGTGSAASFTSPNGIAAFPNGNIVLGDINRIRLVTYPDGVVTTLAGRAAAAFADGVGGGASFNGPYGFAVRSDGIVVIADQLNGRIRLMSQASSSIIQWNDKSGVNNNVTGAGTWTGSNMSFNGGGQMFSNLSYVFPISNYSMFSVYSNTTAPAAGAYMNAVYGSNGFPMLGIFGSSKFVSTRSVVANTGVSGAATMWAARITNSSYGYAGATDLSNNVIVGGNYNAAGSVFNASGTAFVAIPVTAGTSPGYVAKYSSLGVVQWVSTLRGTVATVRGLATDTTANVLAAGQYIGSMAIYNSSGTLDRTLTNASTSFSGFIIKYTGDGGISWAAQISAGSSTNTWVQSIATDSSGSVFVAGYYSSGTLTLYNTGGGVGATLTSIGGNDAYVAKYSSAGTVLWAARIASTASDQGNAVATDSSGSVFVTGIYNAAVTLYNTGGGIGATLALAGSFSCFIAKYSSAGTVLWAAHIGTANGNALATDSSGSVFVTGQYNAAMTLFNTGGTPGATLGFVGGSDIFLAKYSSAGTVTWAAQIAGTTTSADVGYGVATDASGSVFVTGFYVGALTLYNANLGIGATLGSVLNNDAFVAKYSSAGAVLWAARIAGTGQDYGNALATDSIGNVFVFGAYSSSPLTLLNTDGTTARTLTFGTTINAFVAKYSSTGYNISDPIPASSNVLVSATYTPSTFSPFVNGSNATTLAGTTLATTGIFVGGPSNYFNGTISELLIYSANLTSNQRQQVEGYLIDKWQLRAQTLSNHQYKLIPPATSQPPQFAEVTPGNWVRDWQPELRSLVTANASGVTLTGSHITGGATYTANGWFGGVLGPDGNIYFSPFAATNILRLNVTTGVTTNITGGATYTANGWRGGVLGPDGNIYFTPFAATNILRLNVTTGVTTNITGGATYTANGWSGGALGPDGNIYFMPFAATNILRLNVATGVTTNITGGATYTASGWGGAILGPDGNIYGTPYNAANILRLNVATGVTTNITGGATYTTSGWQGQTLGQDGNIYFAPTLATNVIRFNVATGVTTNITGGATLSANATRQCVLGPDGNIYFAPHVGSFILQLNVSTGVITSLTPSGITYNGSGGWQGSILGPDGNIYFSPFAASNILKLTFSGLAQLPSSNYCLSAYTNKS